VAKFHSPTKQQVELWLFVKFLQYSWKLIKHVTVATIFGIITTGKSNRQNVKFKNGSSEKSQSVTNTNQFEKYLESNNLTRNSSADR
jgi:hypothetical protein